MADPETKAALRAVHEKLEEGFRSALEAAGSHPDALQLVAQVAHVLASQVALQAGGTPEEWQRDHDLALGIASRGRGAPPEPEPHVTHWDRRRR
jgi:hypothetical protein